MMKNAFLKTGLVGLATLLTVSGANASDLFADINDDCVVDKADVSRIRSLVGTKIKFDQGDLDGDGAIGKRDYYLARASMGSTCGTHLIGDVDGNGIVGVADLTEVLAAFGTTDAASDINGDRKVNEIDVDMVNAQWGATFGRRLLGDVNGDNLVNAEDLGDVLAAYGSGGGAADMNDDGSVDSFEVRIVNARFGMTAGQQIEGDVDGNFLVDYNDLSLIRAASGTSLTQYDVDGNGQVNDRDYRIASTNFGGIAADALIADVNGDWIVDAADLDLVDAAWGSDYAQADINGDGSIGSGDLSSVLGEWENTHGQELEGDVDGSCEVDATDIALIRAAWGVDFAPADVNADGRVNVTDLSLTLAAFGDRCEKPLQTGSKKPTVSSKPSKTSTKVTTKPTTKAKASKSKVASAKGVTTTK
jgi:hypothetical protein